MEYDKEIKAYLEFKQAERNELDRLKAVTDAHTAERIAEIRERLRKEREALEVAQAKERLEKIVNKNKSDKEEIQVNKDLTKERNEIEKDYRAHEKEQAKKIHEIVKDLQKDEQKKIYAVLEQTEEKKNEYENSSKDSIVKRLNKWAKEYKPTEDKQVYSNVWDEVLACIGAAIIAKTVQVLTGVPLAVIEHGRNTNEKIMEAEREDKERKEEEKRKMSEGISL
jgi:ATP-dependent Lon protease